MNIFDLENPFVQKTVVVLLSVTGLLTVAATLYLAVNQVLIILFAVMLAVPLSSLILFVSRKLHLKYVLSYALVWLSLVALVAGFTLYSADTLANQLSSYSATTFSASQLSDNVPSWVPESVLSELKNFNVLELLKNGNAIGSFKDTASAVFSGLTGLVIFIALVAYLTVDPKTYKKGLLSVTPSIINAKAKYVLEQIPNILNWWMLSRLFSMVAVGLLTYVGLLLLGVESALLLGVTAGLLAFIPNLGPILSAVPAILVALPEGLVMVGWVIGLYVVVQFVESYLITPIVQKRAVSITPALLLGVQIIFGSLFGIMGLLLAGPITAIAVGLHKRKAD